MAEEFRAFGLSADRATEGAGKCGSEDHDIKCTP